MAVPPDTKAIYGTRLIIAGATLAVFGIMYRNAGYREGSTASGRAKATESSTYYDAPWLAQFLTGMAFYYTISRS